MDKYGKPCPFCGLRPELDNSVDSNDDIRYWVECPRCACRGPRASSPEEAVQLWEMRFTGREE